MMLASKQLLEAIVRYTKDKGLVLDDNAAAEVIIPLRNGETIRVSVELLKDSVE